MVSRYRGWKETVAALVTGCPQQRSAVPHGCGHVARDPRPYLLAVIVPLRLGQHGHDALQTAVDHVCPHLLLQCRLQGAEPELRVGLCRLPATPPKRPHMIGYTR